MVRNSQGQLHKDKPCQFHVIFSSDCVSSLVVQWEFGAVIVLDFSNIFDALLCNILINTVREKKTRKISVEKSQLKKITSMCNSQWCWYTGRTGNAHKRELRILIIHMRDTVQKSAVDCASEKEF